MEQADIKRAEILRTISRERLEALVLERAERDEGFALWLDAKFAVSVADEASALLDPVPFRRRAEALFSSTGSGRHRHSWGERAAGIDEAALEQLIDEAGPFLAAGRGAYALTILKPVASGLAAYWPENADWDETLHEFFPRLDQLIAQAALMDGVSQEARDDLAGELADWQGELAKFGADDAFATAIAACMQGWDEPGLQATLAGLWQSWPPGGGSDPLDGHLTQARLAALEAMGRSEHFLNLSRAAGFHCDHGVKLAQTGRVDEAVALAHLRLTTHGDILRLAEAAAAVGRVEAAIDLAAWGLSRDGRGEGGENWRYRTDRAMLARWLREAAHEAANRDMMLRAARVAFEESLSREDFRMAEKLASPSEWLKLRGTLLAALRAAPYANERIEILLDEDLVADAVACINPQETRFFSPRDPTLGRLAERALADHSDWVIVLACRMADPIMSEGRSSRYETAALWLGIAARAHKVCGRSDQWLEHLEGLIEQHRRKHKLRPLLEGLLHTAKE
ncbi:hypothetical protein PWG15_24265 (plasmid) [Ensifer adhaerens]|uniref:hypothetical protein n=1 Tax=Ensifer adhaerens TaxID=106592 RepID=UPI0023A98EDB|nr:hypothetical protein [Ensifer adhaerens]WDZ80871.1 hypothetical protein PWG15_24265 [Ensifer adhaerens]